MNDVEYKMRLERIRQLPLEKRARARLVLIDEYEIGD